MHLVLPRDAQTPECTQGTLALPSGVVLQTLELAWLPDPVYIAGKPGESCVPAGVYALEIHDTPKHPKTWALVNPDLGVIHEPDPAHPFCRTACLLHVANRPRDLEGCIGLGTTRATCVIYDSRSGFASLQAELPWENGHTLEIREVPAYALPTEEEPQ